MPAKGQKTLTKEFQELSAVEDVGALVEIVKNDPSVPDDKRMLYISYAGFFERDLSENLYRTSIELNEAYHTEDASGWQRFLKHPSVKKFINSFVEEDAEKQANKTLNSGELKPNVAMKLKEKIEAKGSGVDNSNIIVVFMPQREYV